MEKAEVSDSPIRAESVLEGDPNFQEALDLQHVINARLVSMTTNVSFALVESVEGNGIEAWRLLSQKYKPRAHSRCVQLVRKIGNFSISRMADVLSG